MNYLNNYLGNELKSKINGLDSNIAINIVI
jgi:hypothetical protein